MATIKQLQYRLSDKKKSLDKVNLNMVKAEKSKNNSALRRLNQEKGSLDSDIRKLERQLVAEKRISREKGLNRYPGGM